MQWFRLYSRMVDDDKLKLLAFEDRWHFVALCCLKSEGLLDEAASDLRDRRIAVRLGVQLRELEEIGRRLREVELVDETLSPLAWDDLQFRSDKSTERVREFRKRQQNQRGNAVKRYETVSETAQNTETETEEPPIIPPGGRRGKTLIPSDWKAPPISELPPRARACAEKWTRASYETEAEGFVLYWQSERKMKADWRGTWANRIIARHSAVMRDQKFGNAPPEPARQFTPDQEIATLERMIPLYQERGQNQHVERARQRIAELGRKRQTQSIGELAKSIAGRVA